MSDTSHSSTTRILIRVTPVHVGDLHVIGEVSPTVSTGTHFDDNRYNDSEDNEPTNNTAGNDWCRVFL